VIAVRRHLRGALSGTGASTRTPQIAITPESPRIVDRGELARFAAAIQTQLTRDFAPAWGIHATVDVFPRLESVPASYWPVVLTRRHLGDDEGFHLTHDGQPFAVVEAIASWSLTASHEILEMVADPSGAHMIEDRRRSRASRVAACSASRRTRRTSRRCFASCRSGTSETARS